MLTFIRKTKNTLLMEGRIVKYILYGAGEVLLVAIGILLAFSVDNWNENRKDRGQEIEYLLSMQEEFSYNLSTLNAAISLNEMHEKESFSLIQSTGPDSEELTEQEFLSIFVPVIMAEMKYRPRDGVISEILNSGKLEIFDQKMRTKISSWKGELEKVQFQEDVEHARYREQLLDLYAEQGNLREFSNSLSSIDLQASKFTNVLGKDLLRSVEFENSLVGFYNTSVFMTSGYYSPLKDSIEETLSLIDQRLDILQ